jgi:hypothetical protein
MALLAEQSTGKRPLKNRLPQAVGAGEVGFDGGFEFFDDGQAVLDFGHDRFLFGERRDIY